MVLVSVSSVPGLLWNGVSGIGTWSRYIFGKELDFFILPEVFSNDHKNFESCHVIEYIECCFLFFFLCSIRYSNKIF